MFSALSQGSIVYILDKTKEPILKIGEVVSVSLPRASFNQFNNQQTVIDLKINIEGNTYEYNTIPSNVSLVTYNSGRIIISESKQGLQQEVESILANSKQIVDSIENYKQNIKSCEQILKELNPQYAKDKERDDRLNNLEERFGGVENKLDMILNLVTREDLRR
jgi:hypothetical protein